MNRYSIQLDMKLDDVEQHLPKSPNFALVFSLAGAAILVFFVLALIFLHFDGSHLTFRHHMSHPTSMLAAPALTRARKLRSLNWPRFTRYWSSDA